MTSAHDIAFTHDRVLHPDETVSFQCSQDRELWPFLDLPSHHPIVIQTLQYWASVEAWLERGTLDKDKWTALTWTEWLCGAADAGHAARGTSEQVIVDGKARIKLTLFDAEGAMTCEMHSKGVVFHNRDFEAWRDKAKQDSAPEEDLAEFDFASREAVGSVGVGPSLISALQEGEKPHAFALISKENGLPPGHPYMSGSGDHVNSTHLAEAAHQFVHLLEDSAPLTITGGEMRFTSYVELGRPLRIDLAERSDDAATMVMSQGDKVCTTVTLRYRRS